MFRSLFATYKRFSGTILRVLLGIVIFPHGAQKFLGRFGGPGFTASIGHITLGSCFVRIFSCKQATGDNPFLGS